MDTERHGNKEYLLRNLTVVKYKISSNFVHKLTLNSSRGQKNQIKEIIR
jgi:hypothetical protein